MGRCMPPVFTAVGVGMTIGTGFERIAGASAAMALNSALTSS
jgi:hypothetical protein